MQKKMILVFCLLLGGLSASATGADGPYDLNACFQAAQKQNEVLAGAKETWVQSHEHLRQAEGALYPTLFGYASYFKQEDSNGLSASNPSDQHLAKLGLTQPLFRGFREYAAMSQTRFLETAAQEGVFEAQLNLYVNVVQSYYGVLTQQKDLAHLETQISLFEKRIRDLTARVAIGRSRPSEVLTVQAALAGIKAQRQQTAGLLQTARSTLAFYTGLTPEISLEGPEPWPAPLETRESYLARVAARPDVRQARSLLEAARESLTLARGGHWPSLDLAGNYYLDRSGSLSNVNWDAQVALTLPLYSGGVTVSKAAEAESQIRQSELACQLTERQARLEIINAYDLLQSDLTQVTALKEAADLGEKNYLAVLKDYNYSLVTNLDVLQALSSYQDALRALDRLQFTVLADARRLEAVTAKNLNQP